MTRSRVSRAAFSGGLALVATTMLGVAVATAADPAVPIAPIPQIVKTSTLPAEGRGAIGLAAFQEALLPGTADEAIPTPPTPTRPDRLINLGSIGSDLFRAPTAATTDFWMTSDRGPNGETTARTFPAPWFTPTIVRARAAGPALQILSATPIRTGAACDRPVTGLPNLGAASPVDGNPYDDAPLAWDGSVSTAVTYTPSGLDTEGLVRLPDGSFWFAEEYSPSIGHVDANGCLQERIVPAGLPLMSADVGATVTKTIPAIFQLRNRNRGFEALALTPSGRYLFVGLQSPLLNPVLSVRNTAQTTRILRYNLESGMFDAEYAYRFDDPSTFPLDSNLDLPGRARDLKLSALVALDDDTLLALERTDFLAKVYLVETSGATNILGTWDCAGAAKSFLGGVSVPVCAGATGASSLEQLSAAGLASNLIAVIAKTRLVTALDARAGLPEKIEGLAVLNEDQIAVANDNDFNVLAGGSGVAFDAGSGNMILRSPGAANHVIRIKLPEPLPLGG